MARLRKSGPKAVEAPSTPASHRSDDDRWFEPATNEDILYSWRRHRENTRRFNRERRIRSAPMIIPCLEPLPYIPLHEIQDCYNKPTAIYWADYRPHIKATKDSVFINPLRSLQVIYPQWFLFKGHNTDIDFGNFIAKVIELQDADGYQQTVADVLKTHRALCKILADRAIELASLEYPYKPKERDAVDMYCYDVDVESPEAYKLKPLFRALIVFIDDAAQEWQDMHVKLIRTGLNDGLSAPINFDSIYADILSHNEEFTVVTVGLRTAIRFVFELDEREKQAFPDLEYKEASLKRSLEYFEELKEFNHPEYTGGDPGDTTTWVDHSKFEGVVVPQGVSSYSG